METLQHFGTGYLTTSVTTHSVGHSNQIPVHIVQSYLVQPHFVITNKMRSYKYHILIVMSHATNPTGCCHLYFHRFI